MTAAVAPSQPTTKRPAIYNWDDALNYIEKLEERCSAYKGQVEAGAARIEELEAALRGLTECVDGLSFAERDVILAVGRTNWSVMRHWISEGRAALQKEPRE